MDDLTTGIIAALFSSIAFWIMVIIAEAMDDDPTLLILWWLMIAVVWVKLDHTVKK